MFEFSDGYKASLYRIHSNLTMESKPVPRRLGEHNLIGLINHPQTGI